MFICIYDLEYKQNQSNLFILNISNSCFVVIMHYLCLHFCLLTQVRRVYKVLPRFISFQIMSLEYAKLSPNILETNTSISKILTTYFFCQKKTPIFANIYHTLETSLDLTLQFVAYRWQPGRAPMRLQ